MEECCKQIWGLITKRESEYTIKTSKKKKKTIKKLIFKHFWKFYDPWIVVKYI